MTEEQEKRMNKLAAKFSKTGSFSHEGFIHGYVAAYSDAQILAGCLLFIKVIPGVAADENARQVLAKYDKAEYD